jgi:alanine-synthesizing transaminase
MRIFEKSVKLNNVCYDIRGPVMDEAGRMEAEGVKILKLNIGNPATFGFRAPQHLVDIMSSNLDKTEGYSDSRGLLSARQAILEYDKKKGIEGVELTDVYTGNGVSELITLSMQGLLDYGDEILVPSPDYPLWTASVSLAGGTAVHYLCDEKAGWYPDLKDIERKITPRTKGIVVINPNNPTGALYPLEILEGIVKMAELHDLIIFADEIYDRLVMDGKKHISIASLTNKCLCITFNGLSKSHLVAGYRVGWMSISGAKENARGYLEGINMLSNMRLCSNVPGQSIMQTALGGYQSVNEYIVPGGRVYEQREVIYNAVNSIPELSTKKPKAGFYLFPKLYTQKFNITDDNRFALDFLKAKRCWWSRAGASTGTSPTISG